MADHKTITTEPLATSKDFNVLRQEGISEIARLAGTIWTDHNSHDPGITILEQLCFLITDLGYRLSFPMKDLLTPSDDDPQKQAKQFFTAKEVFPMHPLTANDYSRLLLDIKGVRNAWVEPIKNSMPWLYWDVNAEKLTFTPSTTTQRVPLNGIYRAILEIKTDYSGDTVKAEAQQVLQRNRNLCEDFGEVIVLPEETIQMSAVIDLEEGAQVDPNSIMAQIHYGLDTFISPTVSFSSLKELLEQGRGVEEIYNGPELTQGFLDQSELKKLKRKKELRVSDLMHIILDIPGVKAVQELKIRRAQKKTDKAQSSQEDWKAWALKLSSGRTARLEGLDKLLNNGSVKFYKKGIQCSLNAAKVETSKKELESTAKGAPTMFEDLPVPRGRYRNLNNYLSVQYEFPENYGIGNAGLPDSASVKRKAQAKQLQAYLMFFDQIMANYNEQLAHVKDLLSVENNVTDTYFAQNLTHVPGAEDIIEEKYTRELQGIMEKDAHERRDRLVDHLLAQFGEKFTDHYLLLHDKLTDTIENKKGFLSNYARLGQNRNSAFDYSDTTTVNTDNVAGLKSRICALLGIDNSHRISLSSGTTEGVHLVEHILLRPEDESRDPVSFFHDFSGFFREKTETATCTSPGHGLFEGDVINLFSSGIFNGDYRVISVHGDTFDIACERGIGQMKMTRTITGFSASSSDSLKTTCTSANHGINEGDEIEISGTQGYDDIYTVSTVTTDGFDIERPFEPGTESTTGQWTRILAITGFSNKDENTLCTCKNHGLNNGEQIEISDAGMYNGTYTAANCTTDTFEINKPFTWKWSRGKDCKDPYSMRISFVFPGSIGRFQESGFRRLALDVIQNETPAHIFCQLFWLDETAMTDFESDYQTWLTKKAAGSADVQVSANALLSRLK